MADVHRGEWWALVRPDGSIIALTMLRVHAEAILATYARSIPYTIRRVSRSVVDGDAIRFSSGVS